MYSAKAQGKNRVERFDPARHGDVARHRTLESHLGDAIVRDEITLRFVPSVDPRTGECLGVEALAYWEHPAFGTLAPADLLRLAGHTGDLPALSRHLLLSACTQIARLPGGSRLRLGIDVTARQMIDSGYADDLLDIVTRCGVAPSRLTLEIVDADGLEAAEQLAVLAGRGVTIALDAATTATATVSSLRDRHVDQLTVDAADAAGLELVLSVGRTLSTRTVVGGVGSAEQLRALRETPVAGVRGDAVAAPMSAAELAGWLAARPALQVV
jgi:EAL domain-containing protein (putative c-di-GMP-specific phosphodiesterase class I)